MAYRLKSVTIRTDNTDAGIKQIQEVWDDIESGRLPLLFDSDGRFEEGISPISRYGNYQSDETGDYDLRITGVTSGFFGEMEQAVAMGRYKKYDECADDLGTCAKMAWERVWGDHKAGVIRRAFTEDYESTVPAAYTKDGKAHCYLYIAVQA